jgi:hypothetical protein
MSISSTGIQFETPSYTKPAFLPSFMKTNKRMKKQMVERGVVLWQYEDNAINKLGGKKKEFVMGQGRT